MDRTSLFVLVVWAVVLFVAGTSGCSNSGESEDQSVGKAVPVGPQEQTPSSPAPAGDPPTASPRSSLRIATYNINWGNADLAGVLSAIRQADADLVCLQEMLTILAHVRTDMPVLVVGDFNSCSTFQAPALLFERGFVDSFAAVTENPDSHPTWHWPTRLGDAMLRIDYIFHSPAFRTRNSRIVPTEGSDHYLLVSEVEFGE